MSQCFLIVPTEFKDAFNGHQRDCNVLNILTVNDGRHVVSLNAVNIFPEVFRDQIDAATFSVHWDWFEPEDFPQGASGLNVGPS